MALAFSRPRIVVPRTMSGTALDALGVTVVIASIAGLVAVWPHLPERVPQHFDFAGHVDAWGSRTTIALLPTIGTVLFIGLTLLMRVPHIYNYPVAVTEANAARLYAVGVSLLRWLKVEIALIFALLEYQGVAIALALPRAQGGWDLIGMLVALFITLITHIVAMFRAR